MPKTYMDFNELFTKVLNWNIEKYYSMQNRGIQNNLLNTTPYLIEFS